MQHIPNCLFLRTRTPAHCLCANRRECRLYVYALALSILAGGIETYGFSLSDSAALFSDIIHIATDGLSYLIVLCVIGVAYVIPLLTERATIFGVWSNLLLLIYGDARIFMEAIDRMIIPREILTAPMMVTAFIGLVLNFIIVKVSRRTPKHEQNIRHTSVDAHALSDFAVSVAVILAAVIIFFTGFREADWIVAFGVGIYLFFGPIMSILRRIIRGDLHPNEIVHIHGHEHKHRHDEEE